VTVAANERMNNLRERPLGEVAKDLTNDLSLLVRQELQLAQAELKQQGRSMVPAVAMFAGAAVAGLCALGAMTAFLVILFSLFLDDWLAALIVTLLLAGAASVLALQGKKILERAKRPPLEETIETVKEDVQWAKTRAQSARR
jgi:uncharacterized membrane protein YqjE